MEFGIFLDIQSCELQCTAALTVSRAILGNYSTVLPIIKRMSDLRSRHDAMRSVFLISCEFPPFGALFGSVSASASLRFEP
jgi:hypothetical protein